MEAREFAKAYPTTLSDAEIHRGPHAEYIREAQDYSYQWGRVLHSAMDTPLDDIRLNTRFQEYYNWLGPDGYGKVVERVLEAPLDIAARGLNELNFHHLNQRMMWLWLPIMEGGWRSDKERNTTINSAQHFLAIDGLTEYMRREECVKQFGGTHVLMEEDVKALHDANTGVMQEYDAAIVLLDVIRRNRNLSVVPAPLQFERSRKQVNVDFVIMDIVDKRALGVQVKSRVRQADIDRADEERVMFLDGDIDLNNVKLARIHKARSTERLIAWPGIIAAKKVDTIKAHGAQVSYFQDPKTAVRLKMIARQLVGNVKVDHRELASRINDRVLEKI